MLLEAGHPEARKYRLAYLWSEARIVRQRHASRVQLDAIVLQTVVSSLFAEDGKLLSKLLKRIEDVG